MLSRYSLSSAALGLALLISTIGPTFTGRASAASAAPQVHVTGHLTTYQIIHSDPDRGQTSSVLTVRIAGSNFAPGTMVHLGVINDYWWKVIATKTLQAQPETVYTRCGTDFNFCAAANPRAGTFSYRIRFSSVPSVANLLVVYRVPGDAPASQNVTIQ